MNATDLHPSQVVLDCVLRYSATMPRLGHAAVLKDNLVIATRNHLGAYVSFVVPVHFDGDPVDGETPRFVLRKLGPTVWKLAPSLLHDLLHAYLTIVDVPEDVAWPVAAKNDGAKP